MYLVICSSYDQPALWAYNSLRLAGLDALELIPSESLAQARVWEHRVGASGVEIKIELPDGRKLCNSRIRGVLNRLTAAPLDVAKYAIESDRDYAVGELGAFYLSWLHCLPNTINHPMPQGLCGVFRHRSEWALLASRAGIPALPYRQTSDDHPSSGFGTVAGNEPDIRRLLWFRGDIFGAVVPRALVEPCRRFGWLAGVDLLGLEFRVSGDRWEFIGGHPQPDLTLGGPAFIEVLARELRKGEVQ